MVEKQATEIHLSHHTEIKSSRRRAPPAKDNDRRAPPPQARDCRPRNGRTAELQALAFFARRTTLLAYAGGVCRFIADEER